MGHPLDQWLCYRDRLPLRVDPLPQPPDELELRHWRDVNFRALAAVATLDERHPHADGGGGSEDADIERLHQKMDLVLDLLGALLRQSRTELAEQAVCLSREGLSWPSVLISPPPGTPVRIELHLHPCAPQPLVWGGEIVGTYQNETWARFAPMGDALLTELERFVFTRHRRSVAGARSPVGWGDGAQ